MSSRDDLALLKSDDFRRLAGKVILDAVSDMLPLAKLDWRVEIGKTALKELHDRGFINNQEQIVNFYEPLPAWLQLVILNRISKEPS